MSSNPLGPNHPLILYEEIREVKLTTTNHHYSTSCPMEDQTQIMANNKIENLLIGRSLGEIAETLRNDYHILDEPLPEQLKYKLIIGHKKSAVEKAFPFDVHLVELPKILGIFKLVPVLNDLLQALWLIGMADQRTCILIDGGLRFGMLTCILNSFMPIRKRKILVWEMYIPTGKLKRWLARRMILGSSLTVVYSHRQLDIQVKLLNLPGNKFIYLPYKAIHSALPPINMHIGSYVFSGGTSRRDYQTLFNAVRETDIPVIVSSSNPSVLHALEIPENVVLLAAHIPEAAFARLMAASCFVVVPIKPGLARGAGEATVLNAMWHGRAVICADDICAFEYIEDGITGYVTPPGDVAKLRERIVELWNQPEKAIEMGFAAHHVVAGNYTNKHFCHRLKMLASLIATST